MSDEGIRINKYLADRGFCSRREADTLIQKGWVKVNGKTLDQMGYKVRPTDKVTVDKKGGEFMEKKATIVLHKPLGFVSSQPEKGYQPAIALVTTENFFGNTSPPRVNPRGFAPAGRLDIDSTGLLILTQNGSLAKSIIGPTSTVEKEYWVTVDGLINDKVIGKLTFGLSLDGKKLKRAEVTEMSGNRLKFILQEGRKRQIRRMCEAVGLRVVALKRVRIGNLKLGNLPSGKWRILGDSEEI